MISFLFRRTLSGLISLFLFLTLLFFIIQLVMPGDFVSLAGVGLSAEQKAELRQELGLDLPILQQYIKWIANVITADLGRPFSDPDTPVWAIIQAALPPTLLIFFTGTVIAFLLGQWLGKITAWRRNQAATQATLATSILLYTAFPPWMIFLAIYFLSRKLELFPPYTSADIWYVHHDLWRATSWTPPQVMSLIVVTFAADVLLLIPLQSKIRNRTRYKSSAIVALLLTFIATLVFWALLGIISQVLEILRFAAMPILIYVVLSFGETVLLMRTSMLDTLHEPYIQTARAKGLTEANIRDHHAARNALIPVLSRLLINLPYLLTGLVIIELQLGWPGMGSILFHSISIQDVPLVMGILVLVGILSLVVRLVLDLLYVLLDPRIRYKIGDTLR